MTGWIRRSTVVILATLGVSAAGSSIAQAACPHLDATCQLGQAVGDAARLVDDTIDPVDTPVDTPVDHLVDPVVDTVDPVVDDVLGVVEDLLGGGHVDLPDPIGGGDGGSHVGRVPRADDDPRDTSSPGDGRRGVAGRHHHGRGLSGFAGPPPIQTPSGAIADRPVDRTSGGDFGAALEGVARSLAIVLALFGLAVAFVAIQDRLDRSDPRLAIAPVDSDVMEFA